MKLTQRQVLLTTLLYADIFDYPLTREEAVYWSVFLPLSRVFRMPKEIAMQKEYMVFPGRHHIVTLRKDRRKWAEEKWQIAKRAGWFLRLIPTIELVGVTGGLAMDNAKKEDDIDFLFIVIPGTIWISRFLAIVCVELCSRRRRLKTTKVKNTICANMFMTSDALALPRDERDLYAAHEILQMRPLWERGEVYRKFLNANAWVKKFLPTAYKNRKRFMNYDLRFKKDTFRILRFAICVLRLFEEPMKILQLWYMRNHRTTEVIGDRMLRFHPKDARVWVKRALSIRLARYKLPLDKIFYAS